ncbi:hypothetical protein U1Q18_000395 [Sarracenia purpurea var. burkii]
MIAPEIGDENADPVSTDGADDGAKSCADAVAERITTTVTKNKIATASNELIDCTIADQKERGSSATASGETRGDAVGGGKGGGGRRW